MTTLEFAKGHGTGNDFILFTDAHGEVPLTPETVRRLCDRHTGIGADGVIRAVRSEAIREGREVLTDEPLAEWFMDYWNADGTVAAMCGNGIRVFAHYLIEEGFVSPERRDTIPIATRAGVRDVLRGVSGYTVDLGRWKLGPERKVAASGLAIDRPGLTIELGNLHVVTALSSEAELNALELGACELGAGGIHKSAVAVGDANEPGSDTLLAGTTAPGQSGQLGPEQRANVEFVTPEEHLLKNGVAHIRLRVYEAGVGETQSCGTGAAAAALAFRHWGGDVMPNSWSVESPGGKVAVRMFPTEEGEHVSVSGPVKIVYRGRVALSDLIQ